MTRAELTEKLNGHVHLTWKQVAWIGGGIVFPWVLTITVAVAMATRDNARQEYILEDRGHVVERFVQVERDMGWVKKSVRRIETWMFGQSVIPPDKPDRAPSEEDEEE